MQASRESGGDTNMAENINMPGMKLTGNILGIVCLQEYEEIPTDVVWYIAFAISGVALVTLLLRRLGGSTYYRRVMEIEITMLFVSTWRPPPDYFFMQWRRFRADNDMPLMHTLLHHDRLLCKKGPKKNHDSGTSGVTSKALENSSSTSYVSRGMVQGGAQSGTASSIDGNNDDQGTLNAAAAGVQ